MENFGTFKYKQRGFGFGIWKNTFIFDGRERVAWQIVIGPWAYSYFMEREKVGG